MIYLYSYIVHIRTVTFFVWWVYTFICTYWQYFKVFTKPHSSGLITCKENQILKPDTVRFLSISDERRPSCHHPVKSLWFWLQNVGLVSHCETGSRTAARHGLRWNSDSVRNSFTAWVSSSHNVTVLQPTTTNQPIEKQHQTTHFLVHVVTVCVNKYE